MGLSRMTDEFDHMHYIGYWQLYYAWLPRRSQQGAWIWLEWAYRRDYSSIREVGTVYMKKSEILSKKSDLWQKSNGVAEE